MAMSNRRRLQRTLKLYSHSAEKIKVPVAAQKMGAPSLARSCSCAKGGKPQPASFIRSISTHGARYGGDEQAV